MLNMMEPMSKMNIFKKMKPRQKMEIPVAAQNRNTQFVAILIKPWQVCVIMGHWWRLVATVWNRVRGKKM